MRASRDFGVYHKLSLCTSRLKHQGREEKAGTFCSGEATRKEEGITMKSPVEEVSWWSSEALRPCGRLLAALVGDVYIVRDMMARYAVRGKTPPPGLRRQYARDQHWICDSEDGSPFTLGWICAHLGLNAQAVQGTYLSGQQLALGPQGVTRDLQHAA